MEPLRSDDPRRLGPYRLLRRVGAGGMGVVFLAVTADGSGDDLAAVKAIRTEYAEDAEFRARFAAEVDLARRVHGPYTARVLDADTEGARPWLATEYVPGPSLHNAVREGGPFPEESLRALAAGLARALAAIHSVGLIHRDLKPSNVLLSPRGPQVIDFGIARATDATALTRTGQALGTPAFMSPEQATGAHLGPESDLFAFGGVLLFAGTGRQPFGTGDPAALLYRVVNEEPDLSGVPEGLLELVTACLAKAPDERPDLGSLLTGLTGTALPEAGAEDPTEWLPTAIATKVMGTVAVTRKELAAHEVPVVRDKPEARGEPEAPDEPEGHEVPEARGEPEGRDELPIWALTRSGPGKSTPPEEVEAATEPEEPREEKEADGPEAPQESTAAEEPSAARRSSPAREPEKPRGTVTPAKSAAVRDSRSPAPALTPNRHAPAYPDPEPRGFSTKALWGTTLSVLALLAGLVVILDPADSRVDNEADASASEENSPSPSRSPRSSPAPEEPDPADIQELAWLSEDRFAVLSSVGVHLYETDQTEPTEQLVDDISRSLGRSQLVTDPGGTALAVQNGGVGRKASSTAVVWDLDADEQYRVRLPETFGSGEPLALSPGGRTLYVGSGTVSGPGNEVAAYDVHSGEELYVIDLPENEAGYQGSVEGLGTTPDGQLLIGAVGNGLAVWDATTGEPVPGVPELREWPTSMSGPMAIADGLVATASYEQLLLWDPWSQAGPESFDVTFDNAEGHPELDPEVKPWITSLSIADDGNTIVAAGHLSQFHGFLRRWDRTGEMLDEQWTDTAQYRAAQAPPSGEGVLVAPLPIGMKDPNTLRLLDDDLETATEFELPTDRP